MMISDNVNYLAFIKNRLSLDAKLNELMSEVKQGERLSLSSITLIKEMRNRLTHLESRLAEIEKNTTIVRVLTLKEAEEA